MSDDKEIWQAYTKGVKRVATPIEKKPKRRTAVKPVKVSEMSPVKQPKSLPIPNPKKSVQVTQLDRKKERALRQGSIEIDGRLDLHGMTQILAYAALEKFTNAQIKRGHRHLLIITGKGSSGHSVLRDNLPQWLENLPIAPHILNLRPAAPKHGGSGAFYLILKRRRE